MADTYIGDLPDGGTVQATDDIPVERSAENFRVRVGTAGTKAASDASKDKLASVNGATVVGNLAVFSDEDGTIADGGAPGAIITGATTLSPVLTTDQTIVIRGGQIYLVTVADLLDAEDPNAGGQFDFSNPINSALAA
ncbi:hypothetical protein J8F10_08915 [Gemmata sp. G18]|uniref:Uncharacterized protein n=1 Tax=Gemmata palustris TaxID=2822762 RepID=A0ABS5BQ22_9BACT|nr:hypothetical protein [Gemmata palustris]MBP3955400.1 hypothetical protein [Gemmata palustris]